MLNITACYEVITRLSVLFSLLKMVINTHLINFQREAEMSHH